MINWILQKNLTKPETLARIKTALVKDNEMWEEVQIVPFSNHIPDLRNQGAFNIIYGSTTFMMNAFNHKELKQGVFYDPIKFQMQNYVAQWKENTLNFEGQLITLGQLKQFKSQSTQKWFIRPNSDGKTFEGKVESFEKLVDWSEKICQLKIPDFNEATEAWISKPQKIKKEWRLFIVDDKIVDSSRYIKEGSLDESESDIPNAMIDFANERILEYKLDEVYVMDIAQVGSEYRLIECNCFNGTGFYKHNIEKIIISINNLIRSKFNV